jgi:hypothetical protein
VAGTSVPRWSMVDLGRRARCRWNRGRPGRCPRPSCGREVARTHRGRPPWNRMPSSIERTCWPGPRRAAGLGAGAPRAAASAPAARWVSSACRPGKPACLFHATTQPRSGVQRGDARTQLGSVQRQPGLQAQGVAGGQTGRGNDAAGDQARPTAPRRGRWAGRSRRRPRRCSRCRPPSTRPAGAPSASVVTVRHPEPCRRRRPRGAPSFQVHAAGRGALHSEDGPGRGDIVDRVVTHGVAGAERSQQAGGVGGVRHDVEALVSQPTTR